MRKAMMVVLVSVVLGGLLGAPARASGPVVSSGKDERADAKLTGTQGLGRKNRRSIDLRKAWITQVGDDYRFTVKIRRVARKKANWDQMFFFTLHHPTSADRTADVGFTQRSHDLAYAYDSESEEWCDITKVTRNRVKKTLSVLVPGRCMPTQEYRVKLWSATGYFRTDAPTWSRDKMRLSRVNYPVSRTAT